MQPQRKKPQLLRPVFPSQISLSFLVAYGISIAFLVVCLKSCWYDFQNVEKVLAFYGTYHREPLNQLIHFFGVPVILWTLITASSHLVLPGSVLLTFPRLHYATMGTVWTLVYFAFYLYLDVTGAILYAPFLYLYYTTSLEWISRDQLQLLQQTQKKQQQQQPPPTTNMNNQWKGSGTLLWYSLLFHCLAWYVQIHPGHHIIEGASPAVLTNLGGALMAAPLFAYYEAIWAVGLRHELYARIHELVTQNTLALCSQDITALRACATL